MPRPLLNPPCAGWKEDLPLPDAPCTSIPGLGYQPPNHQDSIYLEIARNISGARELMAIISLPVIFFTAYLPIETIKTLEQFDFEFLIISIFSLVSGVWGSVFSFESVYLSPATNPFVSTGNEKKSMPTTSNTVGGSLSEPGESSQSATTGRKCAPSAGFSVACREAVRPVSNVGSCCPSSHPERTMSSTGFP